MTVVVHSFVADSSLLDSCDLVGFFLFVCLCVFPHYAYIRQSQVGNRLGFWGGFSCFVSLVSAVCLTDWEAIFCLPPAFVVCSYFLCHRHLCTVSFFHGLFCCKHSCWTFCLSVFDIMLCTCCSSASSVGDSNWIILQVGYPGCGQPYKFLFEANPIWYAAIKVYEIALSEVLATQMGVPEVQHKSHLIWTVQIWPTFTSQRVDSAGTHA